jgi:ribonucleotide monophosphatase NagD (HAD superfamily)
MVALDSARNQIIFLENYQKKRKKCVRRERKMTHLGVLAAAGRVFSSASATAASAAPDVAAALALAVRIRSDSVRL